MAHDETTEETGNEAASEALVQEPDFEDFDFDGEVSSGTQVIPAESAKEMTRESRPKRSPIEEAAQDQTVNETTSPRKTKPSKQAKPPKQAKAPKQSKVKTPKPPREPSATSNRRWFIAGVVVGTVGLVCSIVLALGALTVALGVSTDNSMFSQLTSICDFLVGPVRDLFTFDGPSGDKKGALVAWGIGSMGYLLVGRFLQSVLHKRIKN